MDWAVVIAVTVVRVVQVAIHDVAGVVAVGHRHVPTARPVNVVGGVTSTGMPAGASGWVGPVDLQLVLLDRPIGTHVVQVPIVQIIGVVAVLDTLVPATGAVLMGVIRVHGTAHSSSSGSGSGEGRPSSSAWARALAIRLFTWSSASV